MSGIAIRPYEPADRSAVRSICHETGFIGEPVGWLWRDVESFAELFTGWYTDHEPESASVIEIDGEVSGYLLGCVDTARAANEAVVFARQVVRRGILFRPGTAATAWRMIGDGVLDVAFRGVDPRDAEIRDDRWPAHLHIDLLPRARGLGLGRRLMERWFAQLHAAGVPGCHLGTFAENTGAIAFFESVGFRRCTDPVAVPGFRTREGARMHAQPMVVDLGSSRR